MLKVRYCNEQDLVRVPRRKLSRLLHLAAPERWRSAELGVTVVNGTRMAALNEQYTGRRGGTDVLAFPFGGPGTVDARVLPKGTAFVCDVGMVGSRDSVIGDDIDAVLARFLTQLPHRLPVAQRSQCLQFNAVLIDIDEATGLARSIGRVDRETTQRE